MNFFVFAIFSLSLSLSPNPVSLFLFFSRSCLSFHLSLSHPCRLPLLLPLMSPFIFLSPLSLLLPLCGCLSLPPLSLFLSYSLPPCLSFSVVLSLFLSPALISLSSFSLSLSPIPVSLSLSLSFSLSLSLSHSCLSSYLSHTLSLFLSFLSFSLPSLSLSLSFFTLISFSRSLSLSLSLSLPSLSLSFSFSNPYFSLSHSCLSFHLFSPIPVLFPSFSLSIFASPLSLLLPLCGSLSPSLFHPYLFSYLSLSHRCLIFYILFSFSLMPVSLSLSLSLREPPRNWWLIMSLSCRLVSMVYIFIICL